jgi:hypothetical protein
VSVLLVTAPVRPLVGDVKLLTPSPPSVGHRRTRFSCHDGAPPARSCNSGNRRLCFGWVP